MTADEWDAIYFYCAFVFVKEGRPEYEEPPPGYVGGPQASRVHYEEDIICFPGFGPHANDKMEDSPALRPKPGQDVPVSPRFTDF